MTFDLAWIRPEAPYMPIATAGLLRVLERGTTAEWASTEHGPRLRIGGAYDADAAAESILAAPWPDLSVLAWPNGKPSQGLKPTLKAAGDPSGALRALVEGTREPEAALLRAIVSDGVLDGDGVPARNRLLRGVKADLSSVRSPPKRVTAAGLAVELSDGPAFRSATSDYVLGLVPEVQTFGGTTGPQPSSVYAYSPLLYLLLWHGIMALPPVAVARGPQRSIGGPLVTRPDVLSWPRWRFPAGLQALRSLLALDEVHADHPQRARLRARGLDAVYRARAVPINTTIAVFRWGDQVA